MNNNSNKHHEESIVDLVTEYLKKNSSKPDNSWNNDEGINRNFKLIRKEFNNNLFNALVYAYDKKYGNWEDVNDLRKLFTSTWFNPISNMIGNIQGKKIIAIGSNNGHELYDIFGLTNIKQNDFFVIDISKRAIEIGKKLYHNNSRIHFTQAEIQNIHLKKNTYDISLALRTVHSTGIITDKCVMKCYNITKPGGKIILSISNGYINSLGEPEKGMYDYKTKLIDQSLPWTIVNETAKVLEKAGAKKIETFDADAEIFITAEKS